MAVDNAFWEAEARKLADIMLPWILNMVRNGLDEALVLLEGDTAVLGGAWELVNNQARAWAIAHTADVVAEITETSMAAFMSAFPEWVGSGAPLSDLIDKLKPYYDRIRAELIAVTETTRAYAAGNRTMWAARNVNGMRWRTAVDEMVCPVCNELHDQVAPIDGSFPGGIDLPPAHPGCRCSVIPVTDYQEVISTAEVVESVV